MDQDLSHACHMLLPSSRRYKKTCVRHAILLTCLYHRESKQFRFIVKLFTNEQKKNYIKHL